MTCPNCGLANPDNARFCANCGTRFDAADAPPPGGPYQSQSQSQYQPPQYQSPPYQPPPIAPPPGGNSVIKNIAIGCLIVLAVFMLLTLSCTRACFGFHTRYYDRHHRYL